MTPRRALQAVWILFAILIVAVVFVPLIAASVTPAHAQAPAVEIEIPVHYDAATGLAALRMNDLQRLVQANARFAAELRRLKTMTGCL